MTPTPDAAKCPLESQLAMLAKLGKDIVEVGLEGFGVAGLDAVEPGAVGWQEIQGQALLLELLQHGPDRFGGKARRC